MTTATAMPLRRYDTISMALHWLVAVLVVVQFATGWVWGIFERGSEPRFYLFRTHLVVGSVILALACLRIGWRLRHPAPPLQHAISRLHRIVAKATHGLLYLAILLQPTLGLLAITAFGKSLGAWPRGLHVTLSNVILAIVLLHVAAAFWHQFVRRDGLLLRMLPTRATKRP